MLTANRRALRNHAPEPYTMAVGTLPRQFADLPCGRVAYLRHGKGPPLLLVHGIPTSCRLWEPLLGALGTQYDCIVPDLLGLGRSVPAPGQDLSSPGQAAMLDQLLTALGIEHCFAAFHDQGGAHGMQFLKRYGVRLKAVAFTNVVCYDNWPVPIIALTAALGRLGAVPLLARLRLLQTALSGYSLPRTIVRGRFPKALQDDWFHALNHGGTALADWVRYATSQDNHWTLDALPALKAWTRPARVIWAAQDD